MTDVDLPMTLVPSPRLFRFLYAATHLHRIILLKRINRGPPIGVFHTRNIDTIGGQTKAIIVEPISLEVHDLKSISVGSESLKMATMDIEAMMRTSRSFVKVSLVERRRVSARSASHNASMVQWDSRGREGT
jgi:hypothetical protein